MGYGGYSVYCCRGLSVPAQLGHAGHWLPPVTERTGGGTLSGSQWCRGATRRKGWRGLRLHTGVEFSRARDWLPFPVCLASGGQKAERLQGVTLGCRVTPSYYQFLGGFHVVSGPHGITPPWESLSHQHPSVLYELCQSLRGEHNHVLGGELVFQSDYCDSSQFVLCVLKTSEYLLSANEATYGKCEKNPILVISKPEPDQDYCSRWKGCFSPSPLPSHPVPHMKQLDVAASGVWFCKKPK